MSSVSSVRTRTSPRRWIERSRPTPPASLSGRNDLPYQFVGQRSGAGFRLRQDLLDQGGVVLFVSVNRQPVLHVVDTGRSVDHHFLFTAQEAGGNTRVHTVLDEH